MASEVQTSTIPAPHDELLLELLAALGGAHTRSGLVDWWKQLNLPARAAVNRELSEALGRLVKRKLVLRTADERAWLINDACRHTVLESAHRAYRLHPLTDAIRQVAPLRPHAWSPSHQALARELSWALHLGLHPDAEKEYAGWRDSSAGSRSAALVLGWGLHPSSAGLSRVPNELVCAYLSAAAEYAIEQLVPLADSTIAWSEQHVARLDSFAVNRVATYLALREEPERARALLAALDDPASWATRAFIALTEGELSAARTHARHALDLSRAKSSKRIKGVVADAGIWLVLALLTDREVTSPAYARAQLELERKRGTSMVAGCLEMLDDLVSSGVDSLPDLTGPFKRPRSTWVEVLFYALLMRFRGKPLTRVMDERAMNFAKQAKAGGFGWLVSAFAAVRESSSSQSLVQLYTVDAPWERTLRALEVAIATVGSSAEVQTGEERLAWLFTFTANDFQVTAKLQTRMQNGWSSGRQISWKRLAEAPPSTPFITDLDRRVIRHIRVEREYSRYGSTPYFVLDPRAALDLVGHPRVFADGECRVPVDVALGLARVEVHEDSGGSVLKLEPEALLERSLVCVRESPTRLVVFALDEAQERVARVFDGAPIRLPAEARQAAQQTLGKLASRFSLASEHALSDAQIEEVPADGQLRVRLRRMGGGLAIRVCVVPLPAAPAFAPGQGSARLVVRVAAEQGLKSVCAVRNLEAERQALHALYACCPTLNDAVGGEHEGKLEDLESCLELLCELRAAPEVVIEWPEGEPLTLTAERDVAHVRLRLETAQDWLAAHGELEVDDATRLALHDLLARVTAARSRFIELEDGRYLALTGKLKQTLDGMSALAVVKNARVALHPLWLGVAGLRDDYAELKCDTEVARLVERVREAARLTPALPRGFDAELRGYQREGFEWLSRLAHVRAGACLADDMGLGKTLQALALLVAESSQGPSLVVAPTSVCANWFDEARRFAPALRLHGLGSADRGETIRQLTARDVLVCSYGILQQELETLCTKHFRVVILDEAQAIKNASTQRARAAQQLVGDIRVALTGTPVENHLGELWSIMQFLNPGLLGSAKLFEERFGKPIVRESDARAGRTLKRLIRPFVLRRRKSEVLDDLPSKTVITLRIQPSDAERALLMALRERALSKLTGPTAGAVSANRIQLLAELMRLRRAACHPKLVAPDTDIPSSKLEAFEALLAELREGGHRVLVFSQFIDHLAIVKDRLDALNVSYQYLDGNCSTATRSRAVSAFQAGEGEVFLISLKAGGFGLNLTAADYVVHLDPWWNPAVEEQASDRAHRIGQTRPVTIYRLVLQDSIEEKILALHDDKRDLADRLLEGTNSASALSLSELLALLQAEGEGESVNASLSV